MLNELIKVAKSLTAGKFVVEDSRGVYDTAKVDASNEQKAKEKALEKMMGSKLKDVDAQVVKEALADLRAKKA
jgi:hypothetical protein